MPLTDDERKRWPDYAKYRDAAEDGKYQVIGEFLEWMMAGKAAPYCIAQELGDSPDGEGQYMLMRGLPVERLMCKFIGVDYDRAMMQKDQAINEALDEIRKSRGES